MKREAEIVLEKALTLPENDRAEVAAALLESLEPSPEADVERAWRQEVASRIAGEVETVPWEEIRGRLLARLSERRQS